MIVGYNRQGWPVKSELSTKRQLRNVGIICISISFATNRETEPIDLALANTNGLLPLYSHFVTCHAMIV